MKIRELMTSNPAVCGPHTNAAAIAEILWSRDCGSIPVVNERGQILGLVTDRDLSIALGTRDRRASALRADEVMTTDLVTCGPDDDARRAIELMGTYRVRRLPVVGTDGHLEGIVSVYDLVRVATRTGSGVPTSAVMNAMGRIADRDAPKDAPALVGTRS